MITNTLSHLKQSALYALTASLMILTLLLSFFFVAEPVISYGQVDTESFRVRQTITAESSFLVAPTNVTMAGNINGVTGGNATGTTQFVVISNNATGYRVDINFFNNGTNEAMVGDVVLSEAIRDYGGDVAGQPSYSFTASTAAQFAYSVTSSTTADTDPSFLSNGTNACNTGSTSAGQFNCWKSPTTTAFTIVNRSTPATTGATSTIRFNVNVPSGAVPVPEAQTYTATATLSLFVN